MKKPTNQDFDIFVRRPLLDLRARLSRLDVVAEADIAGLEPFMEATIAAAMIIAHADGDAEPQEHRRLIALFRASPALQGFSVDDIFREIEGHTQAFDIDRESAVARAHSQITATDLTNAQFRALVSVCVSVLEADGVRHAAEEDALAAISALRPWGFR